MGADTSPTDVELVKGIAQGDGSAMGALYDRYAATLFGLALRIVRDPSEAEDTLHDAFVTVAARAGQYVPERGAVGAWLVTLVRNLSIDRLRRRGRQAAIRREVLAAEVDPEPAQSDDPERSFLGAADRERVRRALRNLPEAQRRVLEIAFFEGLSYAEIAEREGVALGTVKSRATRALAALRGALEEP